MVIFYIKSPGLKVGFCAQRSAVVLINCPSSRGYFGPWPRWWGGRCRKVKTRANVRIGPRDRKKSPFSVEKLERWSLGDVRLKSSFNDWCCDVHFPFLLYEFKPRTASSVKSFFFRCHGWFAVSNWSDEASDDKTAHASSNGMWIKLCVNTCQDLSNHNKCKWHNKPIRT